MLVLRFLPNEAKEANEERDELRDGGLVPTMLIGDGFVIRLGEVVEVRDSVKLKPC